jgi:hypothetical protein
LFACRSSVTARFRTHGTVARHAGFATPFMTAAGRRCARSRAPTVDHVVNRSIYNTGNAPGISPDRRSRTPADLHETVRAEMTVPEVVDWPSGSGGRADPAGDGGRLAGYPEPGSCWAHSSGGSGGPRASFGRRRNSFAGPMPSTGRDRSFRHGKWMSPKDSSSVLVEKGRGSR